MQYCKFGQRNADQKGIDMCKKHLLNKESTVKGKTLEFQQMKREKKMKFEKKKKNDVTKKPFYFGRHKYTAVIAVYITVMGLSNMKVGIQIKFR